MRLVLILVTMLGSGGIAWWAFAAVARAVKMGHVMTWAAGRIRRTQRPMEFWSWVVSTVILGIISVALMLVIMAGLVLDWFPNL